MPVIDFPPTSRQAASYLAEERSTKVLRDTELLIEYDKRPAFVVHDIKQPGNQLKAAAITRVLRRVNPKTVIGAVAAECAGPVPLVPVREMAAPSVET